METHDVVVECNRMSLDPVEGTWEELHCPIIASRQMIDRPVANQDTSVNIVQPTAGDIQNLIGLLKNTTVKSFKFLLP